jgi:hypothetical protein
VTTTVQNGPASRERAHIDYHQGQKNLMWHQRRSCSHCKRVSTNGSVKGVDRVQVRQRRTGHLADPERSGPWENTIIVDISASVWSRHRTKGVERNHPHFKRK